ncbi:MAG: SAF domain-containing protein [Lachnospiraceae bacterium]|nr:SAF domain-containing protein [Lachnospiraceae bacterium]
MRKVNIVFIAATVVLLVLNIVQFIVWRNINVNTAETYSAQIADLNATLARYGKDIRVYTVTNGVKAGDLVVASNLEAYTIPSSVDSDQYVHDIDEVTGRVFKVAVNPGTPITSNMTMAEAIEDDMRDRDIILNRITVGIEEGDYIDVRITMPYGDDYLVLSHKRVYGLGENTVKLYLTEFEWMQYQGAMVDYYLNSAYGCTIYADKYIEPGIQQAAVKYYTVPTNIAALIQKDPNIIDKAEASDLNSWRSSIEELLIIFRDEDDTVDVDGTKFATGRQQFNEDVKTDMAERREADEQAADEQEAEAEEEFDFGEDDEWSDTVEPEADTGEGE